jgi:hypothetical protein
MSSPYIVKPFAVPDTVASHSFCDISDIYYDGFEMS